MYSHTSVSHPPRYMYVAISSLLSLSLSLSLSLLPREAHGLISYPSSEFPSLGYWERGYNAPHAINKHKKDRFLYVT
ncbi:hypothetical protein F4820DRAFT_212128 [Hypoxylon rubiginosum]|uniref:Uncharacterized protein n=1 Tax=Hypoxylon rubiginosum TaxID=110542 RepID=A0ACB9YI78_9PEZI|nr:hypothetical protein F4820DRAFT_212128 [Hypoxylon rubiginosum]